MAAPSSRSLERPGDQRLSSAARHLEPWVLVVLALAAVVAIAVRCL